MPEPTPKPLWKSKTFWVNLLTLIVGITSIAGFGDFVDPKLLVLFNGVLNIVLRVYFTDSQIK